MASGIGDALLEAERARRQPEDVLEEIRPEDGGVPEDDSPSESCLHCEINDLVQQYVEGQDNVGIGELRGRMAESLVDLILLAPDEEHAKLLATAIAQLGHAFLEKTGAIRGDSDTTH
jgi:hypothetical protein